MKSFAKLYSRIKMLRVYKTKIKSVSKTFVRFYFEFNQKRENLFGKFQCNRQCTISLCTPCETVINYGLLSLCAVSCKTH